MANAWFFLPAAEESQLAEIFSHTASLRAGIRIFPAGDDCHRLWQKDIPGVPFVINDCDNHYGGVLAFDAAAGRFERLRDASLDSHLHRLKLKHPGWSDKKLTRAATEKCQHGHFSQARLHAARRGAVELEYLQFIVRHLGQLVAIVVDDDEAPPVQKVVFMTMPPDSLEMETLLSLPLNHALVVSL